VNAEEERLLRMNFHKHFMVTPGSKADLRKCDPDETWGWTKGKKADKSIAAAIARMDQLQYLLFAAKSHALLIVLQAPDAGGKDGAIRHVMSGLNPQGVRVTSFKPPSPEELAHDFLWRVHKAVPGRGYIGIFNRSHYEDVLVVRIHKLVPENVWGARYDQINQFEKLLAENNVVILKFFLHISKAEQKARIQERLEDPAKRWKLSQSDFEERKLWHEYQKVYEDALTRCSTPWAPWHIIPANRKWFRNLAVSHIIVQALEKLDMKYPKLDFDPKKFKLR
jgi:PPK2 family polyphosphate:nucleotide phosphotransferase